MTTPARGVVATSCMVVGCGLGAFPSCMLGLGTFPRAWLSVLWIDSRLCLQIPRHASQAAVGVLNGVVGEGT